MCLFVFLSVRLSVCGQGPFCSHKLNLTHVQWVFREEVHKLHISVAVRIRNNCHSCQFLYYYPRIKNFYYRNFSEKVSLVGHFGKFQQVVIGTSVDNSTQGVKTEMKNFLKKDYQNPKCFSNTCLAK